MTTLSKLKASKLKASKSNLCSRSSAISLWIGFLLTSASFYAITAKAAPIYKVIDESTGQVTFTDNPQVYEQQAGKQISETGITTAQSSNNRMNTAQSSSTQASSTSASTPLSPSQTTPPTMTVATQRAPINYQLTMVEPTEERAYQRPSQSIVIKVQTQPLLQKGDTVVITLNGKIVGQGSNASVPTVDVVPGQHSVEVSIKNEAGQTLQQIQRTVYVIQNTAILRQKQQLAEQILAYQRLSWQQKLLLKIRQQDNSANK